MTVLIVDDSRAMRMIIRRSLRRAGLRVGTVLEAGDGIEALERFRERIPDVVLADWNMPRMNGLTLLRQVRKAGYRGPFGLVTVEFTPQMRTLAREAGASFFIAKPFTVDVLGATLSPYLS